MRLRGRPAPTLMHAASWGAAGPLNHPHRDGIVVCQHNELHMGSLVWGHRREGWVWVGLGAAARCV